MPPLAAPQQHPPTVTPAASSFACRHAAGPHVAFVVPTGELDIATVSDLDRTLRDAVGKALVVRDLRELEFIDSSGAHLILAADRRIREAGGCLLVLVEFGGDVEWLLTLTGADRELHFVDEDPAARTGQPLAA